MKGIGDTTTEEGGLQATGESEALQTGMVSSALVEMGGVSMPVVVITAALG